jgi:hypothetical protein
MQGMYLPINHQYIYLQHFSLYIYFLLDLTKEKGDLPNSKMKTAREI